LGGAVIVFMSSVLIANFGWQSAFFVPAILVMGAACFLFNRLRDTPQSIGLPSIEQHKGLVKDSQEEEEEHLPPRELIRLAFSNHLLYYVCMANMFFYIVRLGILSWAPTFLKELKGATLMTDMILRAFLGAWQLGGFPTVTLVVVGGPSVLSI
jgi:OPA family glycerol-3-phosphate transporter-like MFS transporter